MDDVKTDAGNGLWKKTLWHFLLRILKYYAMILLLFVLERSLFLLVHAASFAETSWIEVLSTYYYAFHLDLSAACYLSIIPFVLITMQLAFQSKWFDRILHGYTILLLLVLIITGFGNLFLYDEWGMKLNYRVWYYLQQPAEVLRTATCQQLLVGLGGGAICIAACFWAYLKWVAKPQIEKIRGFYWQAALILIVGLPLTFVGMRGRITGVPITQSSAFFSTNTLLNDAATNTQWNFFKSSISFYKSNEINIFATLDDAVAQKNVDELLVDVDSSYSVLNTQTPNIVIIFLESWSADLIESLGGKKGIAPAFAELEKEGLLFTQVYAAGHRSQEGISTMISANPPIPLNVITDSFDKYGKLSSITDVLNKKGYHSSFYFGGDLDYGNIKAYLMSMQFDKLIDEKSFPVFTPHGSLSIYDEVVLERQWKELHATERPFFSVLFTASTHSPYDVPTPPEPLQWNIPEIAYVNSAHYTDYCLGEYFNKVKKEDWYKNTLFILVADHSHASYNEWNYYDAGYQHIPMLWLGGAIKEEWRGKQIDRYCSYIDLPGTLLKQLGVDASAFRWSKNILGIGGKQFAAVATNVGIEWITPEGSIALDITNDRIYSDTYSNDSLRAKAIEFAKSYLQISYKEYLEK